MEDGDCPVCFESLADRLRVTAPCTHAVCLPCLARLPPPAKCPICRADLSALLPAPPTPPVTPVPRIRVATFPEAIRHLTARMQLSDEIVVPGSLRVAMPLRIQTAEDEA